MIPTPGAGPQRAVQIEHMAVKQCRHGTFLYNVNDTFVGRSLDLYGEWCEAELEILGQVLQPGQVVLDVGANIGTHTVFMAKQVTIAGEVHAFEPQRLVFQNLCANVSLNALQNVSTYRAGLGSKTSTIHVPTLNPRTPWNFAAQSIEGFEQGDRVELLRIDDLAMTRCDLIKIDVEGMECDVLAGGRETITRYCPVLFVENNTLERSRPTLEMLESLGYTSYWHIANYYNPRNYFENEQDVFADYQPEANLLCYHPSRPLNISHLQPVEGLDDDWRKAAHRILASR